MKNARCSLDQALAYTEDCTPPIVQGHHPYHIQHSVLQNPGLISTAHCIQRKFLQYGECCLPTQLKAKLSKLRYMRCSFELHRI